MFKKKITSVEDVFKSSTKDRGLVINFLICILTFVTFYICPTIFQLILFSFIKNEIICSTIARLLTIALIIFYFYKDLIVEFKELKNKFLSKVGTSFKYYGIGIAIMMLSNFILLLV